MSENKPPSIVAEEPMTAGSITFNPGSLTLADFVTPPELAQQAKFHVEPPVMLATMAHIQALEERIAALEQQVRALDRAMPSPVGTMRIGG